MNINPNDKQLMSKLYEMKREQQWCCKFCGGELTDIQTEDFKTSQWGYCECLNCEHQWSLVKILNIVQVNKNAFIEIRAQKAEDEEFRKEIAILEAKAEEELNEFFGTEEITQFDDYDWDKEFS